MRNCDRADGGLFVHAVLGFWLGIYAFRAYVPAAVWNLSDALPLYLKGALAIGVTVLGVAGGFTPWVRGARAMTALAWAVGAIGVLRQMFVSDDVVGSALSLAGWIVWLWWFAAFVCCVPTASMTTVVAAFATAFAGQTGMQAAWHGLDLPLATGVLAVLCAFLLNVAFATTALSARRASHQGGSYGFVAIGAAFFLELTLLANVGRIGQMSGLSLISSALLVQAGCIAGMIFAALRPNTRISAALVVFYVALASVSSGATAAVMLFVSNVTLIAAVAATTSREMKSPAIAFSLGVILQFVLIFNFYNFYELPILWVFAALVVAALALRGQPVDLPRRFIPYAGAGALLALVGAFPQGAPTPRDTAGLRVLSYNIHQGYDAFGVPAMQSIADEIERFDADVIALQEAGRGWDFVGGADLIAYLRRRFPDHAVHFAPSNGQLWGVALLSRLPLADVTGGAFAAKPGAFRYGYVKADVMYEGRRIPVVSVHLTAGLEGDGADGRIDQMEQLLNVVAADSVAVIAGDFNAWPEDPPIQYIVANGFRDAGAAAGIAQLKTWPAANPSERIDYIFVRGSLKAEKGEIRRTFASDHLPVFTMLR